MKPKGGDSRKSTGSGGSGTEVLSALRRGCLPRTQRGVEGRAASQSLFSPLPGHKGEEKTEMPCSAMPSASPPVLDSPGMAGYRVL